MNYTVLLKPAVAKALRKLPAAIGERMEAKILSLSHNPRPADTKKLAGPEGFYRVRVGDYRIVYTINDRELIVLIVDAGHRREIYR